MIDYFNRKADDLDDLDYFKYKTKVHADHMRLAAHIATSARELAEATPDLDKVRYHTNRAYRLAISDADYLSEYPRKESTHA